jgi:uncharacterized protein (DUF1778 family)
MKKTHSIQVRVTLEQKNALAAAANAAGLGLSTWLLTTGLEAARELARQQRSYR